MRKTVRRATPRSVRRAMHPVRTAKRAVTPRPIRQVNRAVYTITNPLGAAENKLIGAALGSGRRRRGSGRTRTTAARRAQPSRTTNTTVSGTGARAAEGAASHRQLAGLMAVQRERFAPAQRLVVPDPPSVDARPFEKQEWTRLKRGAHVWQRAARKRLRHATAEHGQRHAADVYSQACAQQRARQVEADTWWHSLLDGQPAVLRAALEAAFADNPAPVTVTGADGQEATFTLFLPGLDVLPEKKAHLTPTGRLSTKAWTKTERNDVYAELLGAHLLATIRETWAVAPSLRRVRITGVRHGDTADDLLFDVTVAHDTSQWDDDAAGSIVLQTAERGLNRTGRAHEVRTWS
jgi:hypothetical protein